MGLGESGIGVPSYKMGNRQQSAVSKSRESEFPPTEEGYEKSTDGFST